MGKAEQGSFNTSKCTLKRTHEDISIIVQNTLSKFVFMSPLHDGMCVCLATCFFKTTKQSSCQKNLILFLSIQYNLFYIKFKCNSIKI